MVAVYEAIARAVEREGIDAHFTLIGNGNMFLAYALDKGGKVKTYHARHEHCAVAMAEGYARATGGAGFASVTCGAGFTQIMTALTAASRASVPMVVFAGEAPITPNFHIHRINQSMLTAATGAHFITADTMARLPHDIREAFYIARTQSRPVVLSVPEDFQQEPYQGPDIYTPSTALTLKLEPLPPGPATLAEVAKLLRSARQPIIIAGRGAVESDAASALSRLAELSGAFLATSLMAKGLFDSDALEIGIAGGFASQAARELYADADLVLAFGARLGYFTTDGGTLFPRARVVLINLAPEGLWEGLRTGDVHLRADAKLTAEALLEELKDERLCKPLDWALNSAKAVQDTEPDNRSFEIPPGLLDPRIVMRELDEVVPKDWDIVCGGSHFFYFALTYLSGRHPKRIHIINEFGAIGSAFPAAMGVAAARGDGKVLLIEGDGSFLMHAQELETVSRHKLQLAICTVNDGGYASEFHKFRLKNMDDSIAMHGRANLAAIAKGFGLVGRTVSTYGSLRNALEAYENGRTAALWDLQVADIPARQFAEVNMKLAGPGPGGKV
ncbi:thiamine pyrophosphate-binding protein [Chelativorans sp. Marseille-P2723]|uniref:thiamine pyrophosphate-binding protein n=1 Tax=Chelativorans sp. Marseille-P2723 TaxID=2709133 RepID=UPI001571537B|nr:thiamine pyrophosphate-binding protein [Chelativorans sp. Marseille-P2723]